MKTAAAKIEALLHETMGLDAASIGSASVEHAIRARLAACNAETIAEYWDSVKDSRAELQALIEVVVVPETWFSRDAPAFDELTRVARDEWLPNRPGIVRRLLSVPCSTGEEPYSMAMAMLDAGVSQERFEIDAVDISVHALERAHRGVYGKHSFRGPDLAFRDRYFEPVAGGHCVHDTVRRGVRFRQGNILDEDFLADAGPYDAIFYRNLLIYFDKATQHRTIATLRRLLADDGLLFVGPAESNILLGRDFVSAKVPMAFAFRAGSPRGAPAGPRTVPPPAVLQQPKPCIEKHATSQKRQSMPSTAPPDLMDEAALLANQGRLSEAEALCGEQLHKNGPSAALFCLMGLICSADGRISEADRYYRKALYLDQNHHDSLLHLSLLLEQQGDARGAKLLRSRAQRI